MEYTRTLVLSAAVCLAILILAAAYESTEANKIVERQYNTCIEAGKNWNDGTCSS